MLQPEPPSSPQRHPLNREIANLEAASPALRTIRGDGNYNILVLGSNHIVLAAPTLGISSDELMTILRQIAAHDVHSSSTARDLQIVRNVVTRSRFYRDCLRSRRGIPLAGRIAHGNESALHNG